MGYGGCCLCAFQENDTLWRSLTSTAMGYGGVLLLGVVLSVCLSGERYIMTFFDLKSYGLWGCCLCAFQENDTLWCSLTSTAMGYGGVLLLGVVLSVCLSGERYIMTFFDLKSYGLLGCCLCAFQENDTLWRPLTSTAMGYGGVVVRGCVVCVPFRRMIHHDIL